MSLTGDNTSRPGRHRAPRPDPAAIARVRAELARIGKTVSEWARDNGEEPQVALMVLSGRRACTSGAQHRVAVKLGLKQGVIEGEADVQPLAARSDNHRTAGAPMDPLP